MICKYCGAQYTGNKCTSCGKVMPLVKRSTNLDILMIGSSSRAAQPDSPEKTFEQGLKEGYQKGLREGYNNGYAEGKEKAEFVEKPSKTNVKRLIILLASVAVLFSALSGFLFSKIGYNTGYKQGTDFGTEEGKKEGFQAATESMEPQLEERYQAGLEQGKSIGYEQGKQEGYEAAKREYEKENDVLTSQNEGTIPEQPVNPVLDFPYSQAKNSKSSDPVVKKIQERLKELGYKVENEDIKADGFYGPKTEKAVKMFQEQAGINVSGIVDEETYARLFTEEFYTETERPEELMDDNNQPEYDEQEDIDQFRLPDTEETNTPMMYQIPQIVIPINWPIIITTEPEAEKTRTPGIYDSKPEPSPVPSEEENDWMQS